MRRTIRLIYADKFVGEVWADKTEPWNSIKERGYQKLVMDAISPTSKLFGVKIQREKLKFEEKQAA